MKNIKKLGVLLIIAAFGLTIFSSCEKDTDPRQVTYVVKGLTSPFQVAYVDGSGNTIQLDSVQTNMWTATTTAERGDIVYLYLRYRDDIGIGSNFQFRILINGKVYKEAFGKDKDWATDPTFTFPYQIIRQGTVPY